MCKLCRIVLIGTSRRPAHKEVTLATDHVLASDNLECRSFVLTDRVSVSGTQKTSERARVVGSAR